MNEPRSRVEISRWLILLALMLLGQVIVAAEWSSMDLIRGVRLLMSPQLGGDSGRYLEGEIEVGTFPYASYIAITQFIRGTGATTVGVVFLQMLVSVGAARCLLALGEQFGSRFSGWFAAAWYLLFFQIAQWTRYILTESLFFSLTIIIMWLVLHHVLKNPRAWLLAIPLLILVAFTRPNGILLAGSVATFFLFHRIRTRLAYLTVAGLWLVLIGLQQTAPWFRSHGDAQLFDRFMQGEVFWNQTDFQRSMPAPSQPIRSVGDFGLYLLSNPLDSMLLVASRVGWELIQVRTWYADYYNILLVVSMSVFYALATLGWYQMRGSLLNLYVWSVTVPAVALIGVSWAIYEGRFAWWFLVTWLPWVGIGANFLRLKTNLGGKLPNRSG